ncbi:MAG: hypothetical protein PHV18_02170 [Lachnospiraceae bacterium]|nr:hypothetical protein [Lachnospiraceae bacterium]
MKLKKNGFMGIMLASALMLTPTVMAFADSDEAQESEKLYMIGDVETEAPVKVVIEEGNVGRKAENSVADKYAFESDLLSENPATLFEENSKKVSAALNNLNRRTVTIDRATYEFLTDFMDAYMNVYLTKAMPEFDQYYDLSSKARQESKLLVESFAYQNAAVKSNKVESIDSTLNITEIIPIADGVDEILFYLERTLHTNDGNENGGTWFLAHVADSEDGPKLLKLWIQDYIFEMLQNKITRNYLSKGAKVSKDTLEQDILNDIKANSENNSKGPAVSEDEPEDKAGDSVAITIHYLQKR